MQNKYFFHFFFGALIITLSACSSSKVEQKISADNLPKKIISSKSEVPDSYKDIVFPEFQYDIPHPKNFRVKISDSITGYMVRDTKLPLIQFTAYFKESTVPDSIEDRAAANILSPMFRRGGAQGISAQTLEDSLEWSSAHISGGLSSFRSYFSINTLSKDFKETMLLAKQIFTLPAFENEPLEIQKNAFIETFAHRYDNPGQILSALKTRVNYKPNPRLWDANDREYQKVSRADLSRLAKGKFKNKRIVFALSGDFDPDEVMTFLEHYFKNWSDSLVSDKEPAALRLLNQPGIYVVDKKITQANISMNQPFVKRPHPDYYPAAVASFILGGGGFSSRLTTRVRSDEGLAYSIYSRVDNNYRDIGLSTIALQTKAESVSLALKLIQEEIKKLAGEGPTEEELILAKKSLIESLPSLFDSPESVADIFAQDELLGKSENHYLDYVQAINAVTAEQVQTMIRRYFSPEKMTISIVGPSELFSDLAPFTLIPMDSLDFR